MMTIKGHERPVKIAADPVFDFHRAKVLDSFLHSNATTLAPGASRRPALMGVCAALVRMHAAALVGDVPADVPAVPGFASVSAAGSGPARVAVNVDPAESAAERLTPEVGDQ